MTRTLRRRGAACSHGGSAESGRGCATICGRPSMLCCVAYGVDTFFCRPAAAIAAASAAAIASSGAHGVLGRNSALGGRPDGFVRNGSSRAPPALEEL